jgi:hypothetical protein
MVLVSIIVALSIAHLLTAVASAVHRLRGQGEPIELDAVYLLWIAYVLIWLISFWWWEFKLQEIVVEWSYGFYLFVIAYSIVLFMLAAILVPQRMQGVTRSYDYFMHGRKWFFGTLLLVQVVDMIDTFSKGYEWGMRPEALGIYAATISVAITGLVSERRPVQLLAAIVAFAAQLLYQFQELGVLGSW